MTSLDQDWKSRTTVPNVDPDRMSRTMEPHHTDQDRKSRTTVPHVNVVRTSRTMVPNVDLDRKSSTIAHTPSKEMSQRVCTGAGTTKLVFSGDRRGARRE